MTRREPDAVIRRVVVEYGQVYAYCYIADADGKILDDEAFKQPFKLDRKDVHEEARNCYDEVYQWLQDTVLWYSTARDDDPPADSGKPPEK